MKKNNKQQANKIMALTGVGIQMGVTIFLGAYLGKWLDSEYPSDSGKKWFTLLCTLLAVMIALYGVIQQLNYINKKKNGK